MKRIVLIVLCFCLWGCDNFYQKYQQQVIEIPHPSEELAKLPIFEEYDLYASATSCISWEIDENGKRTNFSGIGINENGIKGIIHPTKTKILEFGKPIND